MTTTPHVIGVEPKVLEILGENPTLPYSIIADEVGVTRERVRQIAQRNGYPPRKGISKPKTCPICGREFYTTSNIYCSRGCYGKGGQKRILLNCHQCGKPMERTPGSMRNKSGKYFCNRACFGRWVAKNNSIAPNKRRPITGNFKH